MLRKFVLLGFLAAAASAVASPLNYAFRALPIRAAVVLLDSQQTPLPAPTYPTNDAPHVFYNLESNRNMKPGGWTFYNPSAPSRVTPEIQTRWQALSGVSMPLDEVITKKSAPYWELRLSQAGEAQMAQYDILLVPCYRYVALNANEREKLRRFVEGGGVLWVDTAWEPSFPSPLFVDNLNGFPLSFSITTAVTGLAESFDFSHPIFNRPNTITSADLFNMESEKHHGLGNVVVSNLTGLDVIHTATMYDSNLFRAVGEDDLGTKIAVAQIGEGYMVVTARGLSRTLNQIVDPLTGTFSVNRGPYGLKPAFSRNSDAAAKLVTNMVFLSSSYGQIGKGSRKTNDSILDLGAPMLRSWEAFANLAPGGQFNYIPPAIGKGRVYVATNTELLCLDAKPGGDLDDDGNPDDGTPDYSFGANRDLVWSVPINGPTSPPTLAEVPGSATPDQVALVDGNGVLQVFNAITGAAAGSISAPSNPTVDPGVPGRGPYAPTFHDGMYFIADQFQLGVNDFGRVWMADATSLSLVTSSGAWQCGSSTSPIFQRPTASPTVGYIPINDGSGGLDRVVYFPTRPVSGGGPNGNASINSLWLGTKGEKPFSWAISAGTLFIVTRANLQGLNIYRPTSPSPLGIKLTIFDDNGNPMDQAWMDQRIAPGTQQVAGLLQVPLEAGQTIPSNYSIRVDYSIDWGVGTPGLASQILRGQLFLPDNTARRRRILGNIALGPEGTIHVVHSDPDASSVNSNTGGCYYAFREEKRGEFRMRTRFELFRDYTFTLNQAGTMNYRETLMDVDPLQSMAPGNILSGPFRGQRFIGGPTVHDSIVYVPAGAVKGAFGVPITLVMAFRADPPVPEVVVGDITGAFTVIQPDLARSDVKSAPTLQSVFGQGNYTYERDSGSSRGVIRFENLMNVPRGFIGNSMNLSQPIIIRRNGQPDLVVEPNLTGDRWNPLLWFMAFHGMDGDDGAGPVLATGDTLFFAGKSAIYSIMTSGSLQNRGMVAALNGNIAPNDPFLRADTLRPWQKQLVTFETTPTFKSNPAIRWPQYEGLTSFNDWIIRLGQTVMNSDNALGVVGGENTLAVWSTNGLWAFSKSDYIVCDEGRLARFDGSGNPVWTADAAIKSSLETNVGSSAETKPLVRPTRAYVINDREMLVCDTGSNRIVRLDISGREVRSMDRFNLDASGYRPEGYKEGASTKFREPRDVLMFVTYENNPALVSNPQPRERWVHYLIADSGNKRLVEIVDRYKINATTGRLEGFVQQADGTPAAGILWWHTPALVSDKHYDYNSLSRVFVEDTANPGTGSWVYAAGIGSAMPTRVDLGLDTPTGTTPREAPAGNGGIVLFNSTGTIVINEVSVPDVAQDVYYNPGTGTFNSPLQPLRTKRLGSLQSVTMRNVDDPALGGTRIAIMFTDAEGVFEIVQPVANGPWVVRWMMPREAYRFARRSGTNVSWSNALDLKATFAKRLDSGDVLIVNAYMGGTFGPNPSNPGVKSEFAGEVLTVDGDIDPRSNQPTGFSFGKQNLGFSNLSIKAELPPVQGARGLVVPVFADRR